MKAAEVASKLCMFCGGEIDSRELTNEHFVPKGLWEKGRRPLQTKTLPAHKTCNENYSSDNEFFRDVFVLEDGAEKHPEAQRVRHGAVERKFDKQPGSIKKSLKNARLRRIQTPSGIDVGIWPSYIVDMDRVERVLRNVMKGVYYLKQGKPLPQEFKIPIEEFDPNKHSKIVERMEPWQSFGDTVFRFRYIISNRSPNERMTCLLQFYERRIYYAEAYAPTYLHDPLETFAPANPDSPILVPPWIVDDLESD